MAQAERTAFANLRLETSFERAHISGWHREEEDRGAFDHGDGIEGDQTNSHYYDTPRGGTDEDNSVIRDLHSATPPISVPRHDEPPTEDLSFPHKPDDVQASPLESFIQNQHPYLSLSAHASPNIRQQRALEEPLAKYDARIRTPQRFPPRSSGLRNTLSQEDGESPETSRTPSSPSPRRHQSQRALSTRSNRTVSPTSPDDGLPANSEAEGPTSLTSLSTASPLGDELRTPPEGARGIFSPAFIASSPQAFSSPGEHNSWSGSAVTPFGSKPRGYRGSTPRRSRRSTASSAKSPASMFLSMWNGQETRDMPAPKPDDEGQMVGTDYVLGKQIGFGGFSVVKEAYKVEEHGEPRKLAVKIVKKQIPERSEKENDEVQAEFDHEVHVWRYLTHPNILTLDSVYETDYATFCFTKFAIGGTLFDFIRQNRSGIDTNLVKKYAYQLACALRYLHEDARVVHRDIKLENCLLDPVESSDSTRSCNLMLCDFGMAEWMTTDNGPDSPDEYGDAADRPPPRNIGPAGSSTSKAGSLEYASPELLLSTDGIISPAVDIWAFGVVVFSTIVGSRPFEDGFHPRIPGNIIAGKWSPEAVLGGVEEPHIRQDREDALELIRGCLEMDMEKRWTVREILSSRFLGGFAEYMDEDPTVSW